MSCLVENVLNVARQKTMLTSQNHLQQTVAFMVASMSHNKDETGFSLPKLVVWWSNGMMGLLYYYIAYKTLHKFFFVLVTS